MEKDKFSTIVDIFQYRSINQGDKTAYIHLTDGENDECRITYRELDIKARAIASLLLEHTRTGERALLIYPTGLDFIFAFFGCLYAGLSQYRLILLESIS